MAAFAKRAERRQWPCRALGEGAGAIFRVNADTRASAGLLWLAATNGDLWKNGQRTVCYHFATQLGSAG